MKSAAARPVAIACGRCSPTCACRARSKPSTRSSTASMAATLTAAEAIEQLLDAQIQLRNNRRLQAAMRSSRLPAVKQLPTSISPSSRRCGASRSRACTSSASSSAARMSIFLGPARRRQDAPGDQSGHRRGAERPARLLRHARRSDHLARRSAGRRPPAGAPEGAHASRAARRRRDRLSADQPHRRDALLSADDAPLRARLDRAHVQQGL